MSPTKGKTMAQVRLVKRYDQVDPCWYGSETIAVCVCGWMGETIHAKAGDSLGDAMQHMSTCARGWHS